MRPKIRDEFTDLPISRQRKFQLRMKRDGRCEICGKPSVGAARCIEHLVRAREHQRKRMGLKRRYHSKSYRLQAKATKPARRPSPAQPFSKTRRTEE